MLAQVQELATPAVDWASLSPLIVLVAGALVILLVSTGIVGRAPRGLYAGITVLSAIGTVVAACVLWQRVTDPDRGPFGAIANSLAVDGFTVFVTAVIALGVLLVALLAEDFLRRERLDGPEFYVLVLLSAAGGVVMSMANDLIVLFLGLEILSIALYVLAGMHLRRAGSREAAIKYFVLGSFSSAILLYGVALVYGATGSTNLTHIAEFLGENVLEERGLLLAGMALLLVGLAFKISAVPFHIWTPDVYQGAPTPVTAFMASASKAAAVAALLRVFVTTFDAARLDWQPIVYALAVLTLFVGATFAIVQSDIKRMMAYSSISHAGFLLVGVQTASDRGTSAALFYVATYTFLIVGTFGVIALVSRRGDVGHAVADYRGLARRRPGLALVFAVFLLSQAGAPFTSGFLAKFYVIDAAVEDHSYVLAVLAMLSAVISAFLYLRVVVAMYMSDDDAAVAAAPPIRIPVGAGIALALALVVTIGVGILPDPLVDWAEDAVPAVVASAG